MKTINLLPNWYSKQRRRQRHLRLHVAVMVMLGGAMFGAKMLSKHHLDALNVRRDALAAQLSRVPNPDPELLHEQVVLRRLEDLRLARRELGNTIPMSAVIQQLQNDMFKEMALSDVVIDVRSEPVHGSGVVGDTRNPPRYRDVAHVNVVGIAPPDKSVLVDQFMTRLSRNELFGDVTLNYTHAATLLARLVCKFEIQLSMDLERLTAFVPDAAGPASGAVEAPLVSGGAADGR